MDKLIEIEDDEIAKEAKKRYPYNETDNENRIHKLSSKRRRFIEGAKWMQFMLLNQSHTAKDSSND